MRSEEEILAGTLTVTIGGAEVPLRELRIKELREWKKTLGSVVGEIADIDFMTTPGDISKMVGTVTELAGDRITDLVLAYDKEGALGGREAIEETASATEVYRAFRKMLEAAFPFISDVQTAVSQAQALMQAVQSAPASSTSTPLPNGVSTRKRSKVA